MGKVIMREPCPTCRDKGHDRTGNNKVTYEDGTSYCFRCKLYFNQEDDIDSGFVPENKITDNSQFIQGVYRDLKSRAITRKTCEFYRYQVVDNKHIANYYDSLGRLIKQKIRLPNKKFYNIGDANYLGLCGMHLFKPSKKLYLTITEGEIDMLSVAEVFGCAHAVVSLPNGWGDIEAVIASNLDWLLGWKYVVLALDGDEPGIEATELAIDVLADTSVHVVRWPEHAKDASDMLRAGKEKELRLLISGAPQVVPEAIVDLGLIIKDSLKPVEVGYSWGWKQLDKSTYGMREGELILIGGGSSVGKTTFINQIALKLIFDHHQKVGIISFEQSPQEVTQRLVGHIMKQRIWLPGSVYDIDEAIEAGNLLKGSAYALDTSKGLNTVDKVFNKIVYLVKAVGVKFIFLDHLTCIASMIQGDERRGLDTVMVTLQKIVKELRCFLAVISHFSKPVLYESKDPNTSLTFELGRRPQATDFRGSQSLQYYADTICTLSRNIMSPHSPLVVELLKNRVDSDRVGSRFELAFARDTGRLDEVPEIL